MSGGDARYEPDRDLDLREGAGGTWEDGGGVMSDDDSAGGERNLLFSEWDARLSVLTFGSGEVERVEW